MANLCDDPHNSNIANCIPNSQSYQFSSIGKLSPESLLISNTHPKFEKEGLYIIAIIATTQSIYSVNIISVNNKPIYLKINEPMKLNIVQN